MRPKRFGVSEVALSLGQERRRFGGIILLLGRRHPPAEEFILGDLKVVRDAGKSAVLQDEIYKWATYRFPSCKIVELNNFM